MGMAGDVRGMDEVTVAIEEVRWKEMKVKYRDFAQIENDAENAKDPLQKLWRDLDLAYARDQDDEGVFVAGLNDVFQDQVKPMSISGYLKKY
jgi:hypothetical protein